MSERHDSARKGVASLVTSDDRKVQIPAPARSTARGNETSLSGSVGADIDDNDHADAKSLRDDTPAKPSDPDADALVSALPVLESGGLTSPIPHRTRTLSRYRDHCVRRRRAYIICASVFGVLLLAGVIYGVVVQVLWTRWEASFQRSKSPAPESIKRIWAHSHNDEMQAEPLDLALRLGFGSIEIDTWHTTASDPSGSGYLSVGHEQRDLANKTISSVYLEPLLALLDRNNANATLRGDRGWAGVYSDDRGAEVQLVIDIKNEPDPSYAALVAALEPLRQKGYLTMYDTAKAEWSRGPLIVIVTGDGPLPAVHHAQPRMIFYDAPLLSLDRPYSIPQTTYGPAAGPLDWTPTISPMASGKLPWHAHLAVVLPPPPSNVVVQQLKWYADQAKQKGIRSRWWGAARSSQWVRERIWSVIRESGSEWTGGDDLEQMAEWLKRHQG